MNTIQEGPLNSKERVKTAMDLQMPDRTPLMCQMSIGHMLQQLPVSPAQFWFDAEAFANGLIRLREIYDFDGILVSLHGHDPDWRSQIASHEESHGRETVVLDDGRSMIFMNNDLPQFLGGTKSRPSIEELDLTDLPDSIDYIPVSQGLHFKIHAGHRFDAIEKIISRAGQEYSIHGEITSPFDYFLDLLGNEEGLMALIEQPEKSELVLDHFTRLLEGLAGKMCETGVDAIKISSPFAGAGFISPDFYTRFVSPFESRISHVIRRNGVHAYLHTCGSIGDRLELMLDSGASGIECLDPPPLGNVELDLAVDLAKGKGFIKGNIDSVNTLLHGTDDEILSDARNRLEIGKKGSGFILSTACSIAPMVKREKVQLLRKAVEQWG